MKKLSLLLFVIAIWGINGWASKPHSSEWAFVADSVKVSFEKGTITIIEGDSSLITIRLMGEIPKDSTIEIKYSVKETDATATKDFKLRGPSTFTFKSSTAAIQSFEMLTIKDNNEERESITLELSIVKGGKIAKIAGGKCVIILKDFKTLTELAQEKYREENTKVLNTVRGIINNDKDTSEMIGKIRIKKFTVKSWYLNEKRKPWKSRARGFADSTKLQETAKIKESKTETINKVDVLFRYGVAAEIKAYANSGEVYNNLWYNDSTKRRTRAGISFRHQMYNSKYQGFLLTGKNNPKSVIRMFDLIEYDDSVGVNFLPNDTTIRLTKKDSVAKMYVKTSLSSYVHLNIYSDALNLFKADRGNALLQTEASAKIFMRTIPTKRKMNFLLNYISPYLKYNRFENGFNSVIADTIREKKDTTISIDRMLVNQRKYLDIGLKLNIFTLVTRFYNTAELNVFCNFGWFDRRGDIDQAQTKLIGTTQYQGITNNTFDFGIEGRYSIFQYRNFGINLAGMAYCQKIWNNKLSAFTNSGYEFFYRTEAEIFYFPIANSKDKIFLRSYHIMNNSTKEANFTQLQIGYKALFKLPNTKK